MTKVEKFFNLASKIAKKGDIRRHYRIGAVGIRSDGTVVVSNNSACHHPQKAAHAEARLVRKLNQGSIVFVVRILADDTLANARPCDACQAVLRRRGIERVIYSIGDFHYGVIIF